jgi:hypothetical protein
MSIKPTLSIFRTKVVHLLASGTEADGGGGIRLLLQYQDPSSIWNETIDFAHKGTTITDDAKEKPIDDLSPIELLKFVAENNMTAREQLQFAEENLSGVSVGGETFDWDTLADEGYEFVSPSRRSVMKM